MVSSGPNNRELRDGWRQRMAEVQQRRGIRVVFLVANTTTSGDQQRLETEHEEEGDILQCGVKVNTSMRSILDLLENILLGWSQTVGLQDPLWTRLGLRALSWRETRSQD